MSSTNGLNMVSQWCIYAQFIILGIMFTMLVIYTAYRARHSKKLQRGNQFGAALTFHSPDSVPRFFRQYGYCTTLFGSIAVYSWIAVPLIGYLLMIWGVWIAYTIGEGLYFPPSVNFWKDAFGSWDGLMLPWCVLFTITHLLAGVSSKVFSAMRTQAMMPCARMEDATHVVVSEEFNVGQYDDLCHDPDESEADDACRLAHWIVKLRELWERFDRAQRRQVVKIQEDECGRRYIEYTCVHYVFDGNHDCFVPTGLLEASPQEALLRLQQGGMTHADAEEALRLCGDNAIDVPVPSILEALVHEFTDFTYIFNSIGTWNYIAYSSWNIGFVWLAMILGSGLYRALCIIRPTQQKLAKMAEMSQRCEVLRQGKWCTVEASKIALGDIVKVTDGDNVKLPCDGIVIEGSLIVDESMLTGEPMPIAKVPVEGTAHARISDKLNKAFAGTSVLESNGALGSSLIFCTSIGALTTRGQLVRMVLCPSNVKFKYNDQLPYVYVLMSVWVAILEVILIFFSDSGSLVANYLVALATFTMTLNPMLPVSMVMGQTASASRLEQKNGEYQIRCLQPGRIPIAGKISTMVFDKTGTITKAGMDLAAVVSASFGRFISRVDFNISDPDSEDNRSKVFDLKLVPLPLCQALGCCHTVKMLKSGQLVGNQVECAMLRTSSWKLGHRVITSPHGEVLRVVKELEFDHHRMTSGSVVRNKDGQAFIFLKGSYERIREIALPQSVPADYDEVAQKCAQENYYTLGISFKALPLELSDSDILNLHRQDLESAVSICGLLLFRNEMKSDSPEAIEQLKAGSVRSVICTGDNELTGIAIGRKCGVVNSERCLKGDVRDGKLGWSDPDRVQLGLTSIPSPCSELAVTSAAWRYLLQEETQLKQLWSRIVVFARMKPDDKINVVRYLQQQGLVVGMAGDGGNDCGGLRAAHAGIALSEAEASMVAPFSTSRLGKGAASQDISLTTVPDLIREGRACLATNLATFQYYMVYGFALTSIRTYFIVLNAISQGEWTWMLFDIGIGVVMMYFMTQSKAKSYLAPYRPTATLLGLRTLSAIFFPFVTGMIGIAVALYILWQQDWYDPLNPVYDIHVLARFWMKKGDNYDSPVGSLFLFTIFSTTAYVNTFGGDFRRNICLNRGINVVYGGFVIFVFFLTLSSPSEFNCIFRVNCDTRSSLKCKNIPVLTQLSVGGTGGCFLGPQLKYWQRDAASYYVPETANENFWFPSEHADCLPPKPTLERIPLNSTQITTGKGHIVTENCFGPNNCYSASYKKFLAGLLASYMVINIAFAKFVLMGPVAEGLRRRHKLQDRSTLRDEFDSIASASSSSDEEGIEMRQVEC